MAAEMDSNLLLNPTLGFLPSLPAPRPGKKAGMAQSEEVFAVAHPLTVIISQWL